MQLEVDLGGKKIPRSSLAQTIVTREPASRNAVGSRLVPGPFPRPASIPPPGLLSPVRAALTPCGARRLLRLGTGDAHVGGLGGMGQVRLD